uniref:Predicted protein n=1 Tax=Hordeum vulgare subsp. vulgare TaxID=112509 RepID=F2EK04_HORVV|nr:predicted protein [Hordeum vulgare subsp. vulgare]
MSSNDYRRPLMRPIGGGGRRPLMRSIGESWVFFRLALPFDKYRWRRSEASDEACRRWLEIRRGKRFVVCCRRFLGTYYHLEGCPTCVILFVHPYAMYCLFTHGDKDVNSVRQCSK